MRLDLQAVLKLSNINKNRRQCLLSSVNTVRYGSPFAHMLIPNSAIFQSNPNQNKTEVVDDGLLSEY